MSVQRESIPSMVVSASEGHLYCKWWNGRDAHYAYFMPADGDQWELDVIGINGDLRYQDPSIDDVPDRVLRQLQVRGHEIVGWSP